MTDHVPLMEELKLKLDEQGAREMDALLQKFHRQAKQIAKRSKGGTTTAHLLTVLITRTKAN